MQNTLFFLAITAAIVALGWFTAESERRKKVVRIRKIIRDVESGTLKLKADVLSRLGELL